MVAGCHVFSSFERVGKVFLVELLRVIRGLSLAWKLGVRKLICETYSLDVFNCLNRAGSLSLHSCLQYLAEVRCLIHQDCGGVPSYYQRDEYSY